MLRLGLFCIYLCLIVGLVFLETVQLPFSIKQGFQWNGLNSILCVQYTLSEYIFEWLEITMWVMLSIC